MEGGHESMLPCDPECMGSDITQEDIDALGIPQDVLDAVVGKWGEEWWKE